MLTLVLRSWQEYSEALVGLQDLVEQTIDLDEMSSHNYVIKPDFDENLQSIKEQLIEARDGLDEEHQRVGRVLELDTEKKLLLENQQVYGYCLRVTKAVSRSVASVRKQRRVLTFSLFLFAGGIVDPREEGLSRARNSEGRNLLHDVDAEGALVELR